MKDTIKQLEEELIRLDAEVSGYEERIQNIELEIEELQNQLITLEEEENDLLEKIEELEIEIDILVHEE